MNFFKRKKRLVNKIVYVEIIEHHKTIKHEIHTLNEGNGIFIYRLEDTETWSVKTAKDGSEYLDYNRTYNVHNARSDFLTLQMLPNKEILIPYNIIKQWVITTEETPETFKLKKYVEEIEEV